MRSKVQLVTEIVTGNIFTYTQKRWIIILYQSEQNGIWRCLKFSDSFETRWHAVDNNINCQIVSTIIFHSIFWEIKVDFSVCTKLNVEYVPWLICISNERLSWNEFFQRSQLSCPKCWRLTGWTCMQNVIRVGQMETF